MDRNNKRKKQHQNLPNDFKKQRHQRTSQEQEQEEWENLQHLDDYYEEMEPIEQKQVKEFEKMEQLTTEQLDDDYVELFKQIALLEEQEIKEKEEQHYNEMQNQLEQLEAEEKVPQLEQVEYYRWLEHSQQQQQQQLKQRDISLDNDTCLKKLFKTFLRPASYFENGVIQPTNDDHYTNEYEKEDWMMETGNEMNYQQRLQQELSNRVFPAKLVDIIEEYDQSIELIIQSIDEEFNEDDWMLTDDDEKKQQQFDHIYIWFLNAYSFPKKEWPIVFLDRQCNIRSIRHQLKRRHRLLLEVYHDNRFYICHRNEIKRKIIKHMNHTDTYIIIQDLNQTNNEYVERLLNRIIQQLITKLNDLHDRNYISEYQLQQMQMDPTRVRLDFLSFQPDTRYKDVPFRAKMTCCLGPTLALSRFLSTILQPVYDQVTQSMTFIQGVHAVDALELYTKKGFLQTTTLFATFYVDDLYTTFSHEETLQLLERFLNEYVSDRQIQGIHIEFIIELVTFFLQNQYFIYQNKVYRQIKGSGGSSSPLSIILANINMFYRQQDLVNHLFSKKELFGRCVDEAFMTWNGSPNELYDLFQIMARNQHPFISLRFSISKKVRFLEAELGHSCGEIDNKVNHESFDYPFSFIPQHNDPIQKKIVLVQTVLDRAVRCCSNRDSYNNEQRYLEFMFDRYDISLVSIINSMNNRLYRSLYYDISKHGETKEYDCYRSRIQTIEKEKQQQQDIWVINCPLKGQQLMELKQDFQSFLEHYSETHLDFKNVNMEITHRPNYPANTK